MTTRHPIYKYIDYMSLTHYINNICIYHTGSKGCRTMYLIWLLCYVAFFDLDLRCSCDWDKSLI